MGRECGGVSSKTESPITSDRLSSPRVPAWRCETPRIEGARAGVSTRGGGGARWLGVGRTNVECVRGGANK